jgi:tetratricopeptide (TPR) repeat protein
MDPKHRKRFTYPVPRTGTETKALLDDLLATLPKLEEGNPFEKELSGLLKDSLSWLAGLKEPGSFSPARRKLPRKSRRSEDADTVPDAEAVQSLFEAGKFAKAKRAARQVLRGIDVKKAIAEEARSPEASGPVTGAVQVLTLIALAQGDINRAKKGFRLLAKLYSSYAGQDAEATLNYKFWLADLCEDDEPKKAIDLLDEVIDSCERLEATHSTICTAAKSLGGALRIHAEDPEELDKAATYLRDAEEVQREAYEDDPEAWQPLALTIGRLAQLAQHRDECEEAAEHYERAAGLYRSHVDPEDRERVLEFAALLMRYGECLVGDDNKKAIRAGRESVNLIRQTFGPLSTEAIPFLLDMGNLYRETNTREGAEKACRMFRKVVVLHEQHYRDVEDYLAEAGSLLEAQKGLIVSYTTLQSYKEAEFSAKRALRVVVDLDNDPVEQHQIYKLLSFICEQDGRPVEAQQYESLARQLWESAEEPDDEDAEDDDEDEDDQWWRGDAQGDGENA